MQDLDALGLLVTDFDVLAVQTIIAVEPDPVQLPLAADLDAAAALCHDAARLLAGAWVGRQLTVNMPPRAWFEEFAEAVPGGCRPVADIARDRRRSRPPRREGPAVSRARPASGGFVRQVRLDPGTDTGRYPFTLPVVRHLVAVGALELDPG